MRAAVIEKVGRISVQDVPEPTPAPDSIKVRVDACALCGSDLRILTRGDSRATFPCIPGHEIAGTVVEVGTRVTGYAAGDRVTVAPGASCGKCLYCLRGQGNVCINPQPPIGYASPGGFAEYVCPPTNVVLNGYVNHIPPGLSAEHASLAEPLACCINGLENARLERNDSVLVIGAGPIGCMMLALARARGAAKTFVLQRSEARRALAARFDPDLVLDPADAGWKDQLLDATDGLGADIVIVAAPSGTAAQAALGAVAPKGRVLIFGGLPDAEKMLQVDGNLIHYKEVSLVGASSSLGRQNKEALGLLASGAVDPRKLITDRVPLDDIARAVAIAQGRRALKVIVQPHP